MASYSYRLQHRRTGRGPWAGNSIAKAAPSKIAPVVDQLMMDYMPTVCSIFRRTDFPSWKSEWLCAYTDEEQLAFFLPEEYVDVMYKHGWQVVQLQLSHFELGDSEKHVAYHPDHITQQQVLDADQVKNLVAKFAMAA